MYAIEVTDDSPHAEKLVAYKEQMLEIKHFSELSYTENKETHLQAQITHFVDVARAELEQQLTYAEKSVFYTIITAALIFSPEPCDLALKCATSAIRYSKPPAPYYATLLIASRAFLMCLQMRRAELLASYAAIQNRDCPDAFLLLAEIYRQMESESAPEMALTAAKTALKLEQSADSWFYYGMALLRGGNLLYLAKAHNALKKAVSLHEAAKHPCPDVRFNLALLSKIRMDFQMCWDQLEKAIEDNAYFSSAASVKDGLEKLAATICSKIGPHGVELGLINNETDGFKGIASGLNVGELEMQVVSYLDSGIPHLFLVADMKYVFKCVLALTQDFGELAGKTIKIKAYMAQQIILKSKTYTYYFVAFYIKNEPYDMWIDGHRASDLQFDDYAQQ